MRRRDFLMSGAALTLAWPAEAKSDDDRLAHLLTWHFETQLAANPERATELGLDTGSRASYRRRLTDRSPEAARHQARTANEQLRALRQIERSRLSAAGALDYDIALFRYEGLANRLTRFPYHAEGAGRVGPYIVTQTGGVYGSVPAFLENQHPLRTSDDALAYLARLEALPAALDSETARVAENASRGVIAPDFVIDGALAALRRLHGTAGPETAVVRALAARGAAAGLAVDITAAAHVMDDPVRAALGRQLELLGRLRRQATSHAGVDRLPDGEAYYAALLRLHTTTTLSANEIHALGLDQVAELTARMDSLLKSQGYTQGSVGARLDRLKKDPAFLWPNTEEGRAAILASLEKNMTDLAARLPRAFRSVPKTRLEIRRLPVALEDGASPGGYQAAPLDGSRPGIFYVNLKDTADWPKWFAPTFGYHEGNPGHHFQTAVAREGGKIPSYRSTQGFNAFIEGWALYAERVADELGVYDAEPLLRLGYLQSSLFRALRLVVDTGLHAKGWSRDRAIAYLLDGGGLPEGATVREVDRYCIQPGQACAYKVGETAIARLRMDAEDRLGARFDLRDFHDILLSNGPLPLSVLNQLVAQWMKQAG